MPFTLTEEQQAIVNHDLGPALVFAVAGAGKTTAMVYRMERLVREAIFTPSQILATSFSRATVWSLVNGLARWPQCAGVKPVTLHALGYGLIRRAQRLGLAPPASGGGDHPDDQGRQVLWLTIAEARRRQVEWRKALDGLDRQDFLDYIGACKGNLRYADLLGAGLPAGVKRIAEQATAPAQLPWYLDLYRLFEEVRRRERVITFDDMLLQGWELLVKHPALLEEMRTRYRCVLVDEFQDINRAQSEILDLITAAGRNYMAIGDDDQTIYEWRGADPHYILAFPKRYRAVVFHIQDNFRCTASQVALANMVIKHNTRREKKALQLTRGFAGSTTLHTPENSEGMARELVAEVIRQWREQGHRLLDQVVLIRLYAQTPLIEQQLTMAGVPYRVIGSTPFYARPEVHCLVQYLRLFIQERKLARGELLTPEEQQAQQEAWFGVYNTPSRYLSRAFAEETLAISQREKRPLGDALRQARRQSAPSAPEETQLLATLLAVLARRAEGETATQITQALLEQTGYRDYLTATSSQREIGEGKVATVEAFLHYTAGFPSVAALLAQLDELRRWHEATDSADEYLALLTIFRAKGREWPIVYVPHCHEGIIPFRHQECNLEEERRLLYVAITRTKTDLHLYACRDETLSSFLQQANARQTLASVAGIENTLTRPALEWSGAETLAFAKQAQDLGLTRYFTYWLNPDDGVRQIAAQIVGCSHFLQRRKDELAKTLQRLAAAWEALLPPGDMAPATPALQQELLSMPNPFSGKPAAVPPAFTTGDRVVHPTFGQGTVLGVSSSRKGNTKVTVQFARSGTKTLLLEFAGLTHADGQ